MRDAAVLRQRAKVQLRARRRRSRKLLPVRVAIVEIVLTDGTRLDASASSAVRGTVRNPMTRDEVVARPAT